MFNNVYKQPQECQFCQLKVFSLPPINLSQASFSSGTDSVADNNLTVISPTYALGSKMVPEIIHYDWVNRPVPIDLKKIKLPSPAEISTSLWMPKTSMNDARDYTSYECHDLRIAYVQPGTKDLLVLYCQRVEPDKNAESLRTAEVNSRAEIHTAPINGFNWPIGGRRMCAKPGSPLDGKFSVYHSALLKAQQEAGINPKNVYGMFDLGIGCTEFAQDMTYFGHQKLENGQAIAARTSIHMPYAQRTINRNFVILTDYIDLRADGTVKDFKFISAADYRNPLTRAKFCSYEQKFLEALFAGWENRQTFRD
jgi:hypothetical protein